ncbi:S1 RNA-binding domain-containing protein [Kamptonema animale CS-326]|jgi:small subunit ribosomal protein S1|uniref:S1 RNA-binding domain-containing protein n=1 Tax=Kamptonema animale TaxID=92934 RepID=UPI00232C067F|nr:S1 RNA-binding domain-containing protein [Kamptonema animale]MDB9512201.1 S1 RNA-binding domain-containing protein [Kamptonema animale CS-326]
MNPKSTGSQGAKASFSMDDFAKALEQHNYEFQKGQVVRGRVEEIESNGAYIDIGAKSPAFLPLEEVALRAVTDLSKLLPLQEEREFLIIRDQNEDGQVTLSLRQLEIKKTWDQVAEMFNTGAVIQVRVTGHNKGGVTVDVMGMRGFIPRSHVVERDNLQSLVGQSMSVSFLEVDREREKLVLSQRAATKSASFSQLEIGQIIEGKISSIKQFGVFVDFDGITGLLHIKEVSQKYINNLEKVFSVGQIIKAMIINLNEERGRISLSTRLLESYPGQIVEKIDEMMATAEERSEQARKALLESEKVDN